MPARSSLNVSLTPELEKFIQSFTSAHQRYDFVERLDFFVHLRNLTPPGEAIAAGV